MADDLLDRRLLVVTGKGGVGKSTVAAALGLVGARRGKRVVVAEVGRRSDVPAMLRAAPTGPGAAADGDAPARDDGFHERRLLDDLPGSLWHASVSPEAALREYLRDQLPLGPLAELLRSDRLFAGLTAATPGLRELLAMGKLWELAQDERRTPGAEPYDLCVVDAPASGHATTLLGAPAQFAATAKAGPVARQGAKIAATIADPERSAGVLVAAPTLLAVSEALTLEAGLHEAAGLRVGLGVVDGITPSRFSPADREALGGHVADPAVAVALAEAERADDERRHAERFASELAAAVVTLPRTATRGVRPSDLEILAGALDAGLREAAGATG